MNNIKLNYIECQKGGLHQGQLLNMMCLNSQCSEELIYCSACIQESHKNHNIKPIKLILKQAFDESYQKKITQLNIDLLLDIISSNQRKTLQTFEIYKIKIEQQLNHVLKSINNYYHSIFQDLKVRNCSPIAQYYHAYDSLASAQNIINFKQAVATLVSLVSTLKNQQPIDLSQGQFIQSLKLSNKKIECSLQNTIDDINEGIAIFRETLNKQMNCKVVFQKKGSKFSNNFKHSDAILLSEYLVRSTNNYGYKFAIVQPSLEKGKNIEIFSFKICRSTKGWVAVGICYKNKIQSKGYNFDYRDIGHGAYLISSNGGSWSSLQTEENNVVKAFEFEMEDIIKCTVDFDQQIILFNKIPGNQSYILQFQKIQGDEIHPCALLYYVGDQIQFLPQFKG